MISLFKLRSYSFDQDLCFCAGEGKQTVVALEETNFSLDTVGLLVATLDIVGHRISHRWTQKAKSGRAAVASS